MPQDRYSLSPIKTFLIIGLVMALPVTIYMMIGVYRVDLELPFFEKELNIPNPALKYSIRIELDRNQKRITNLNVGKITELECDLHSSFDYKTRLTGLDYLKNLEHLHLYNGRINDLTPLSSLTKLTGLKLLKSEIKEISALQSLTNLTSLSLTENMIEELSPLRELKKLEVLELKGNSISDLSSIAELDRLKVVELGDNLITDISPLLNSKSLDSLEYVSLYNNTGIPPEQIEALRELGIKVYY